MFCVLVHTFVPPINPWDIYFTLFCSVSIVDFQQVNVSWVSIPLHVFILISYYNELALSKFLVSIFFFFFKTKHFSETAIYIHLSIINQLLEAIIFYEKYFAFFFLQRKLFTLVTSFILTPSIRIVEKLLWANEQS